MDLTLAGLLGNVCFAYLDDVVIYAKNLQEHEDKINKVLDQLRAAGLKLQCAKCEFLKKEVVYLGHVISDQGVSPNPDKLTAVEQFPTPKSRKNVQQFLGLCNYYRKFIPNFSTISKPLTILLKKDTPFHWKNNQVEAFQCLKDKLTNAPVLAFPNFDEPFIVAADASDVGIAGVLSQGPIGQDRPIAYASRTLDETERRWDTLDQEGTAIVFANTTISHLHIRQ